MVAVSELPGGMLDLTLSFWDSAVDEQDARRALDCLKNMLGAMGSDTTATCGGMVSSLM